MSVQKPATSFHVKFCGWMEDGQTMKVYLRRRSVSAFCFGATFELEQFTKEPD